MSSRPDLLKIIRLKRCLVEKHLSRYDLDPETGCHIWNGPTSHYSKHTDQYGRISFKIGKTSVKVSAHRLSYAYHNKEDPGELLAEILESLPADKRIPYEICCIGAVARGPIHCTCWKIKYNAEQQPATGIVTPTRTKCCGDCAYRSDSQERTGADSGYNHSASEPGGMPELPARGKFYCHIGMRYAVEYYHPPTGLRIPVGHSDDYCPPITDDGALLANGDVAPLCAGFSAVSGVKA